MQSVLVDQIEKGLNAAHHRRLVRVPLQGAAHPIHPPLIRAADIRRLGKRPPHDFCRAVPRGPNLQQLDRLPVNAPLEIQLLAHMRRRTPHLHESLGGFLDAFEVQFIEGQGRLLPENHKSDTGTAIEPIRHQNFFRIRLRLR